MELVFGYLGIFRLLIAMGTQLLKFLKMYFLIFILLGSSVGCKRSRMRDAGHHAMQ